MSVNQYLVSHNDGALLTTSRETFPVDTSSVITTSLSLDSSSGGNSLTIGTIDDALAAGNYYSLLFPSTIGSLNDALRIRDVSTGELEWYAAQAQNDSIITLSAGSAALQITNPQFSTNQSSAQTTTIDLSNTGVTGGNFGSSSTIPSLTVDAQGRITTILTNTFGFSDLSDLPAAPIVDSILMYNVSTTSYSWAVGSASVENGTSKISVAENSDLSIVHSGSNVADFDVNGMKIPANKKIQFYDNNAGTDGAASGASALEIYHNTIDSYISDVGLGGLYIRGSDSIIIDSAAGVAIAEFKSDGTNSERCLLNFNGNLKLATSATGVDVTGELIVSDKVTISGLLSGVSDPVAATDAANRRFVESILNGLVWLPVVDLVAASNQDVSTPATTIDGVTLSTLTSPVRILCINQTDGIENGVWEYDLSSTTWSRPADFSTGSGAANKTVTIDGGTYAGKGYTCSNMNSADTIDTDATTWIEFIKPLYLTDSNSITQTGNTIALASTISSSHTFSSQTTHSGGIESGGDLSFTSAATIETGGNNALTINTGTSATTFSGPIIGSLRTDSSGIGSSGVRPSIDNTSDPRSVGAYEITAQNGSTAGDDGFLRLSAGGFTDESRCSYIDISGYSNVSDMADNIVMHTRNVERLRIDSIGASVAVPLTINSEGEALILNDDSGGTEPHSYMTLKHGGTGHGLIGFSDSKVMQVKGEGSTTSVKVEVGTGILEVKSGGDVELTNMKTSGTVTLSGLSTQTESDILYIDSSGIVTKGAAPSAGLGTFTLASPTAGGLAIWGATSSSTSTDTTGGEFFIGIGSGNANDKYLLPPVSAANMGTVIKITNTATIFTYKVEVNNSGTDTINGTGTEVAMGLETFAVFTMIANGNTSGNTAATNWICEYHTVTATSRPTS